MKLNQSMVGYILDNYSQIELMAKYFNLEIEDIEYCLEDTTNKVSNALREDNTPSLGFMYRDDGRLIAKDWANSIYNGDIFDIVALLMEYDIHNPKEFAKIYKIIVNNNKITANILFKNVHKINAKSQTIIRYKQRPYTLSEVKYWKAGGVTTKLLAARNIYVAEYVWVNDMLKPVYIYTPKNPAFVYYYNTINKIDIFKIYLPKSKTKELKFITNNKSPLEASHELYKADTLIISKSRKDKLVIESMLYYDGRYVAEDVLCGCSYFILAVNKKSTNELANLTIPKYCVTSVNSESIRLSKEIVTKLYTFYNNIIIYVDYDREGILCAFYHYILYGFKPVFLGNQNDIYSKLTKKEVKKYLDKILLQDDTITLYDSMLDDFIETYRADYKQKDLFEYATVNGYNKAEDLINKIFKI